MDSGVVENSIKQSIAKNGFPEKIVRLPFKPIYDCCKKNGVALKEVLKNLRGEKILGSIQGDFITFHSPDKSIPEPPETPPDLEVPLGFPDSNLADMGGIRDFALRQLSTLTPEQQTDLRQMAENMSDEQKARILALFAQLSKPKH